MLRQYQVARAAVTASTTSNSHNSSGGNHHGVGAADAGIWALKEPRDAVSAPHARPMSAKILAVGIALVAVVVLAVALIMGLEFPKYVHAQVSEDQCVINQQHPKYNSWRLGTQWSRQVYLYFWELSNVDGFLYSGQLPQVRQRGPYVYTENETREDVQFNSETATFRVSRSHVFSQNRTNEECPTCSENDTVRHLTKHHVHRGLASEIRFAFMKVNKLSEPSIEGLQCYLNMFRRQKWLRLTVLNVDYLRQVFAKGGDVNYVLSLLTSFLQDVLTSNGLYVSDTFMTNLTLLGCLDNSCDKLPHVLANVSFGKWLQVSNSSYCKEIETNRSSAPFNVTELRGLYGALLNESALGTKLLSVDQADDLNHQCRKWASDVCQGVASKDVNDNCGLVHLLQECGHRSTAAPRVQEIVSNFFCPSDTRCLNLTSASTPVFFTYLEALTDFILQHLVKVTQNFELLQRNRDLVVTMTQNDLAMGYFLYSDTDQGEVSRHVQGLLTEDWLKSDYSTGVSWTVDTCLQGRSISNNLKVRELRACSVGVFGGFFSSRPLEFNGSQYAPPSLLRNPAERVSVQGQTDFTDACSSRPTCQTCSASSQYLFLYLPSLQRTLTYTWRDVMSLWGVDVHRYWLMADNFVWDASYQVSCGLQTLTSALGFFGWISVPKVTVTQLSSAGGDLRNCSLPEIESFVDVEPVSGRLWQKKTQLQLNVGIRPQDVASPRWRPLNISYLSKAIPLVWTDRRVLLDSSEVGYYNYKVVRLMRVSCGGLIGLSVVSIIVLIVGSIIFFYPTHINRVGPAPEESSIANLHSRHLNAN